jgi:hypothetical protein
LPTLLLFVDGKIRDRIEGFHSRDSLQLALERIRLISLDLGRELEPQSLPLRQC